jgi:glycosylphosphatidylinositol transamidase (GPIT) subunit GPI8
VIECLPDHLLEEHRKRFQDRLREISHTRNSKLNSLIAKLNKLKQKPNQKLEIQDIKEQLEFAHKLSDNQQLMDEIISYVDTMCEKRMEYLRNKPLSVYVDLI